MDLFTFLCVLAFLQFWRTLQIALLRHVASQISRVITIHILSISSCPQVLLFSNIRQKVETSPPQPEAVSWTLSKDLYLMLTHSGEFQTPRYRTDCALLTRVLGLGHFSREGLRPQIVSGTFNSFSQKTQHLITAENTIFTVENTIFRRTDPGVPAMTHMALYSVLVAN